MDEFTLREELSRGEDSQRQFKRQIDNPDHLAKDIVAFLNTRGGKIYVGVNDDGSVVGVSPEALGKLANVISNACTGNIKPPVGVLTTNVFTRDGVVVVIEVPDGWDKPYQDRHGEFWQKRGADKRRVLERSELKRLLLSGRGGYADSSPVPNTSLADFDLEKLRKFYAHRYPGEELSYEEEELIRQLQGIRLMVGQQLSVAAVLLFAKHPEVILPAFNIKAVWFKGVDRAGTEYLDSRRFAGTLQTQYEEALIFLRRWNRQIQVDQSFNAPASPEIPEMVFEELLVNALVHRDYFIADSVRLFIFDNRLEVISPGCLPNSLTEEEALRGIGRDRNPLLLSLAYDLMRYRGSRSGLKRVRTAIPNVSLINDIEAEQVVVTVPLP